MERLYRFSPIGSEEELFAAIEYIHFTCFALCKQVMGEYLPVAENLAIFCHYQDEYEYLTRLREELTDETDNFMQKYFRLREPITIPARDGVPAATYTYLYIRRPDPYRAQVGDVDFVLQPSEHKKLKDALIAGNNREGARVFASDELNMIELHNPDKDVLSYLVTEKITEVI